MNFLTEIITTPFVDRLGWALVHFVWQGVLIAVFLAAVLRFLPHRRPEVRYLASCTALLAMAVCPVATSLLLTVHEPAVLTNVVRDEVPPAPPGPAPLPSARSDVLIDAPLPAADPASTPARALLASAGLRSWSHRLADLLAPVLPWFVLVWAVGVMVLSARLAGGWLHLRRVARRMVKPVAVRWEESFGRILMRLGIRRPVRLLESAVVQVPTAIGWLRPVVLLPASAITGLTPEHIEAILAHELAHIRRHDYLVNLVQSVVETLLFYHPAVWWVSKQIRIERENCCDDIAAAACESQETYIGALVRLEELRVDRLRLAAALDGASLLHRVRRLLGVVPERDRIPAWVAGLVVIGLVLGLGLAVRLSVASSPGAKDEGGAAARTVETIDRSTIEEHIAAAEKAGEFDRAGTLAEELLGDYPRARKDLLEYRNHINPKADYALWQTALRVAVLAAHGGDFPGAEEWLAKAKEVQPQRRNEDIEAKVARCRAKVPVRKALEEKYAATPSFEAGMALVRAHLELGELPAARWLIEAMGKRFAGDRLLEGGKFAKIRDLVFATFERMPEEVPKGPPLRAARDPRVEAVFERLRRKWEDEGDRALSTWDSWPTFQKAKFLNLYIHQVPPHGLDWEPTEEEAAAFLRGQGFTGAGDRRERKAREMVREMVRDRSRSGRDARDLVNQDEHASLIEALASIGAVAVDDLLAKVQEAEWDTPAGHDAQWAAEALQKMGRAAVPGLARDIEKCCQREPAGGSHFGRLRLLIHALVGIDDGPERTNALRHVLDVPISDIAVMALGALSRSHALTEDFLIGLYERSEVLHVAALEALAQQGGDKALKVLDRDIPSAYAEAAYRLKAASWEIASRIISDPGPRPEPIRRTTKGDYPVLWEGVERTLRSSCPVLRIFALGRIRRLAEEDLGKIPTILAKAREDPEPMVRARAAGFFLETIGAHIHAMRERGDSVEPLLVYFEAFVDMVEKGQEGVSEALLASASAFKGQPVYRRAVALAVDRLASEEPARRSNALYAFTYLAWDDRSLTTSLDPQERSKMVVAVQEGLCVKSGRVKIDAISAAWLFHLPEAVPGLLKVAKGDQDPYFRREAAKALGKIGDRRAIKGLEEIAAQDPYVDENGLHANREEAMRAIEAIQGGGG